MEFDFAKNYRHAKRNIQRVLDNPTPKEVLRSLDAQASGVGRKLLPRKKNRAARSRREGSVVVVRAPATKGVMVTGGRQGVVTETSALSLTLRQSDDFRMVLYGNPMLWLSTRLSSQAKLYSQYRWVKLRMKYNPTLPTSTQGTITFGVLPFGASVLEGALDEELRVSPGGVTTPIWQPTAFAPDLAQYSGWHTCKVAINDGAMPFYLVAHTSGLSSSDISVGTITAEYTIQFASKTTGKSTVSTYAGTMDTTLASGVCTQPAIYAMNIGSIGVVVGEVDAGDMGLSVGDLMVVGTKMAGTSVNVNPVRAGTALGESMTFTALPIQWFKFERDSTD